MPREKPPEVGAVGEAMKNTAKKKCSGCHSDRCTSCIAWLLNLLINVDENNSPKL